MKRLLIIILLLSTSNTSADLHLADTDVEKIVELAHDYIPGQVSGISPRDGHYYGYDPKDGNVTGYVFVTVQTRSGTNGLIIAKVDGTWTVTPSIRQRLRERAYRKERRLNALKRNNAPAMKDKAL